jgi:hypothetical protein
MNNYNKYRYRLIYILNIFKCYQIIYQFMIIYTIYIIYIISLRLYYKIPLNSFR